MSAYRLKALRNLKKEELLAGAALGFFMFGGYAFQTAGLLYTTPAKSGFVTGSSVVLVPLLLAIFWRKHLARWAYAGASCAVIGLYFLTVPVEGLARLNRGDILTFAAAALYAVHIILVGDYTQRHSHGALSVLQVAACAVLAWISTGALAVTKWEPVRFDASRELLIGIAVCAIFATAAAFSMQLWAQQYTTPSHAAIIFTLEPAPRRHHVLTSSSANASTPAPSSAPSSSSAESSSPNYSALPAAPESPEPVFEGRIYFEMWWRL